MIATALALVFAAFWGIGLVAAVFGLLAVPVVLAVLLWRGSGRRQPA